MAQLGELIRLSDNNMGASRVIRDYMTQIGEREAITSLNKVGIVGSDIWLTYKDVCKENMNCFIIAMRAVEMGVFTKEQLRHAMDNRGAGFNAEAVNTEVLKRTLATLKRDEA